MRVGILVAALAGVAAANANAAVVIGDFETGNDGWAALGAATAVVSSAWADTGDQSMLITTNNAWPTFALVDSAPDLPGVLANSKLQVTVHWLAGEVPDPSGLRPIISATGNGNGGNPTSSYDDLGTQYYYSTVDDLTADTVVLSWDYHPDQLQGVVNGGLTSWQITLGAWSLSDATYAVDNINVSSVPEPTVLAGVAVTSFALMLRKRRK